MTEPGSNTRSIVLDTSTLTITPLIWPNRARTHDLLYSTRVHLPLHHWHDRTGLEHTIYCTRHEYTYHYTSDMTEPGSNTRSIVLDTSTLTITPLIWYAEARYIWLIDGRRRSYNINCIYKFTFNNISVISCLLVLLVEK
jgi:hypothetical protein